ncbi:IS110 family transposase [Algoriphagus sp. Y33]|uniref:IS110 family transposase n=1 Tax=Algoriphagus sp. Y33 TaxID=2772483 RepID=UPI00178660F9|nr:IS110 family transposase [Algoriphagus sp. Y33]
MDESYKPKFTKYLKISLYEIEHDPVPTETHRGMIINRQTPHQQDRSFLGRGGVTQQQSCPPQEEARRLDCGVKLCWHLDFLLLLRQVKGILKMTQLEETYVLSLHAKAVKIVFWISARSCGQVNAQHVKNVSGRKTDVLDCQWIQQLHSYGLLSASFQPEDMIRTLRGYMRHRKNLTQAYSTQILHMQKAFEQLNIKLHNVITDITGKSGQLIINAILDGERDPERLASLAVGRVKASKEEIVLSLEGTRKVEPLFELRQSYELYLIYKQKITDCDTQIQKHMEELAGENGTGKCQEIPRRVYSKNRFSFNATPYLADIVGVDLTRIFGISEVCAMEIVSEVGVDMSKWPSERQFTSWLNLCPHNRISGGKLLKNKKKKSKNKAGQAFRMAAFALQRSDHYLGAFYRRMKSKGGALFATKATARKLAVIFYHMVGSQLEFNPISLEEYEKSHADRKLTYLKRQASKLGLELMPAGDS